MGMRICCFGMGWVEFGLIEGRESVKGLVMVDEQGGWVIPEGEDVCVCGGLVSVHGWA